MEPMRPPRKPCELIAKLGKTFGLVEAAAIIKLKCLITPKHQIARALRRNRESLALCKQQRERGEYREAAFL